LTAKATRGAPAKPAPAIELGADPRVLKRLAKGTPPGVLAAWDDLKAKLRTDPRFMAPDRKTIWGKAFPGIPNHRHEDLPAAWRAAWTIRNSESGTKELVTVLFVGSHKEYDDLYGFATS
jgi:hypothetical protein